MVYVIMVLIANLSKVKRVASFYIYQPFGFLLCEAPLHALFPTFSIDANFFLIDF